MYALAFTNIVFFAYITYLAVERKSGAFKSKLFWMLLLGLIVSLYITSLFLFKEDNVPVNIGL